MAVNHRGFPIRTSPDRCLFAAPRGLSQLATSFIGSYCQGIHPALFFTWPLQEICLNQKLVNCIVTYNLTNYLYLNLSPDVPQIVFPHLLFWHTLLVITYALSCLNFSFSSPYCLSFANNFLQWKSYFYNFLFLVFRLCFHMRPNCSFPRFSERPSIISNLNLFL